MSLSAYLDVARFLGLDGHALLKQFGIPPFALNDPDHRLPAMPAVRLLERSAQSAGVDSFGIRMAECRSFASIGGLSLLLEHLATVREVVSTLARYQRSLSDVLCVGLEEHDEVAIVSFELPPEVNYAQAADLQLALAHMILVGASSGRWAPEAVHFTHGRPADIACFARYFQAPLEFDSTFTGFSCSRRSLDTPLPLANRTMAVTAARLLAAAAPAEPSSVCENVRQSIALLLPSGRAAVKAVAANLDLSERSLQRLLANEGCTFGGLLDEVRGELAKRHLSSSARSLTDIAEDLGYSKLSSFSRWFTHKFGMSPRAWRKDRLAGAEGPPPVWKIG